MTCAFGAFSSMICGSPLQVPPISHTSKVREPLTPSSTTSPVQHRRIAQQMTMPNVSPKLANSLPFDPPPPRPTSKTKRGHPQHHFASNGIPEEVRLT